MRFVLRLLTGLAVLLFHHHVGAQQVQLHASTIVPGDLAVLTVIYRNQRPSMFKLDTSPLEQDFDVIDVKSKISMDRQGGTFANRMIWRVMLAPKRSGLLRIPPLTIREAVTPELQLTVLPENPWLVSGEDIRLELSANKQQPRVGEQFNLKLRFYSNRPIKEGFLSDPRTADTRQLGLGRDRVTTTLIDGVEHQVLERNIAMFAQSPGRLVIEPAAFRGLLAANADSAERYFLRQSQPISIDVRPIADGFETTGWYPLKKVALSQSWQMPEGPLQPGDQLIRRIALQSDGLPVNRFAANLFELETSGAEAYLDQPQRSQNATPEALRAEFLQDQLIVINHEGPLYLPPLRFDFWDTELDQPGSVELEGKLLDVPPVQLATPQIHQARQTGAPVFVLAGFIVVMGALGAVITRWRSRRRLHDVYGYHPQLLRRACYQNDAVTVMHQLLAWGRSQGLINKTQGLQALASMVDVNNLRHRLLELDGNLFASNPAPWRGKPIWIAVKRYRKPVTTKRPASPGGLPLLAPINR